MARLRRRLPEKSSDIEAVKSALEIAIEQKARDVRGLDVSQFSDIADFYVIASGNSDRHVRGIADKIRAALKEAGEELIAVSGYENSEWVLMDYGNYVIHIFFEPTRHFYNVDELWNLGTPISLTPELAREAKKLRTGIFSFA